MRGQAHEKTKAALLVFVILIVFYASFVVWSIHEYNSYVSALIERYDELLPNARDYITRILMLLFGMDN